MLCLESGQAPVSYSFFGLLLLLAILLSESSLRRTAPLWLCLIPFILGSLLTNLLIGARALYLLIVIPAFLFALADRHAHPLLLKRTIPASWRLPAVCAIVLGLWVPVGLARKEPPGQPILEFSRLMVTYPNLEKRILAFSPSSFCLYLEMTTNEPCTPLPTKILQGSSLREILDQHAIHFLLVDPVIRKAARELGQSDLLDFEEHPEKFGFRLIFESGDGRFGSHFDSSIPRRARGYVRSGI